MDMTDQFAKWDRFMAHYKHTGNAAKAKRWLAYEEWKEAKRLKRLREAADNLANQSLLVAEQALASKRPT